jgi:hypothetical protein
MTEISLNSLSDNFGRSPPRKVLTSLTISPRRSNPAFIKAMARWGDRRGLEAMMTCPSGTRTLASSSPIVEKIAEAPTIPLWKGQ